MEKKQQDINIKMSLRIVPNSNHDSTISSTLVGPVSNAAPGLLDGLKNGDGPISLASKINNRHPLECRLQNWEQTQYDARLETYRRIYGAGEPIKRQMELNIIDATDFKPSVLGGPDSMHKDILLGKDSSVDWEDVYKGGFESGNNVRDFHSEMETKLGL